MKTSLNFLFFEFLLLSIHSALDKVISFFLFDVDFAIILEILLHEVSSSAMSGVKLEFVAACAALSHELLLSD